MVQQKPKDKYKKSTSVPGFSPGYSLSTPDRQNGQGLSKSGLVILQLKTFPTAATLKFIAL